MVIEALALQDILGVTTPMAVSPLVGLTALSAGTFLADRGVAPFTHMEALQQAGPMGAAPVLIILALLLAAKLAMDVMPVKIVQVLDKFFSFLEDNGAVVMAVVLPILMMSGSGVPGTDPGGAPSPVVLSPVVVAWFGMPILTGPRLVLIAVIGVINVFTIVSVRFFFEMLVFLSPFGVVDALFNIMKDLSSAGLFVLYLLNPAVALAVNLVLLAVALVMLGYALRVTAYYRYLWFRPAVAVVLRNLFGVRRRSLAGHVPSFVRAVIREPALCIPVVLQKRWGGIRRRQVCWLVSSRGAGVAPRLMHRRWGKTVEELLPEDTAHLSITPSVDRLAVASHGNSASRGGSAPFTMAVSREWDHLTDEIARELAIPLEERESASGRRWFADFAALRRE